MTGRRPLAALALGAALALFAGRELGAMRADGPTADEAAHLAYGERGLAHGDFGRTNDMLNSKMPVSALNAVPVAAAARLGAAPVEGRRLWLARLPTVGLGMLLGWLVWAWGRELFGARGAALGLLLYTFCPNVLAHSHLVTTDVATALGMFGATYAWWRHRQRPTGGRLAVAAAAFGLAQLTKATALFLVPIFGLVALAEWVRTRRAPAPRPRALRTAGAFLAAALVALNLGFACQQTFTPLSRYRAVSRSFQALAAVPVLRDLPLPLPLPYVAGLDMVTRDAGSAAPVYLHGRFSTHGFRTYYLVAALLKVPLGTLALLALAGWLAASGRLRAPAAEAFLLVPPAFLLVYLSFAFNLQIGLRYLLPAFPFLFVFAGRVAAWRPAGLPARRSGLELSRLLLPAAGLLAAWTAVSSLAAHPHYIPYFNELAGGERHAWRWLTDSNVDWGQDNDYVRQVVARRGPVRVWIEPGGPIAGRVASGLTPLVLRHPWLRDHFEPAAVVRGSWAIFDITQAQIDACCAGEPQAWTVPDDAGDLAPAGRPIGGSPAPGVTVRFLERLNDGLVGANSDWDAARSSPQPAPVAAWFGIAWRQPQRIGRVVAYPGFLSRGPAARRFLALDYVLQWWDGAAWRDLPGTRVTGNRRLHVEHAFPPVTTTALRLFVERERNGQGTEAAPGVFRAACLELAVFPP